MPFMRFAFNTSLSAEQVVGRLALVTSIEPSWWPPRNDSPATFFGAVGDRSFKLRRNIKYRNSFLPTIHGVVVDDVGETRVKVTMSLHPFVAVFLLVWFAFIGVFIEKLIASNEFAWTGPAAVPVGMGVFAIALTIGAFFPEAYIAKRIIMTTLKAEALP